MSGSLYFGLYIRNCVSVMNLGFFANLISPPIRCWRRSFFLCTSTSAIKSFRNTLVPITTNVLCCWCHSCVPLLWLIDSELCVFYERILFRKSYVSTYAFRFWTLCFWTFWFWTFCFWTCCFWTFCVCALCVLAFCCFTFCFWTLCVQHDFV